jgi:hypothetical protein
LLLDTPAVVDKDSIGASSVIFGWISDIQWTLERGFAEFLVIKPEQHEIDRAGKRLLRDVLEGLGWVVNDVQEDYGIDSNVQVFEKESATGTWFAVQLKSSSSSEYSAAGNFVSQPLPIDRARHYAFEMRDPVLLIHADVEAKALFWYAPQLDDHLAGVLREAKGQDASASHLRR